MLIISRFSVSSVLGFIRPKVDYSECNKIITGLDIDSFCLFYDDELTAIVEELC